MRLKQSIDECTCTKNEPGPCQDREVETRTVRLPDHHVLDCDWGGGFDATLEAAGHEWFHWAFPDHEQGQCDEFDQRAVILERGDRWILLVFDVEDHLWRFRMSRFDPNDFPADET